MEPILGSPSTPQGNGGTATPEGLIKDSDIQNFQRDVLDASMQVPVLVDFWATWCGPCKQLTPALEKAVTEARGAVRLVKIDVDRNQALAQQLRIQSVPTVYAFFQGQPVDGFQGAVPESQLKAFIDQLVQMGGGAGGQSVSIAEILEQAAKLHAEGDLQAAASIYAEAIHQDPENLVAIAGVLRCRLDMGDGAGAQQAFDSLPPEVKDKPELESVRLAIELAGHEVDSGELAELMEKVSHDPNDHQARFDLAQALYGAGKREAAVDALLEIVSRQRGWNEEAARKELLKYFEAWGPGDPLTLDARRRLSALLFA